MSKLNTSIYVLIRFNSGSYVKRLQPWGENYVARKKEILILFLIGFRTYLFDMSAATYFSFHIHYTMTDRTNIEQITVNLLP